MWLRFKRVFSSLKCQFEMKTSNKATISTPLCHMQTQLTTTNLNGCVSLIYEPSTYFFTHFFMFYQRWLMPPSHLTSLKCWKWSLFNFRQCGPFCLKWSCLKALMSLMVAHMTWKVCSLTNLIYSRALSFSHTSLRPPS